MISNTGKESVELSKYKTCYVTCHFAESECDVIWQLVTIQGFFKGSTSYNWIQLGLKMLTKLTVKIKPKVSKTE